MNSVLLLVMTTWAAGDGPPLTPIPAPSPADGAHVSVYSGMVSPQSCDCEGTEYVEESGSHKGSKICGWVRGLFHRHSECSDCSQDNYVAEEAPATPVVVGEVVMPNVTEEAPVVMGSSEPYMASGANEYGWSSEEPAKGSKIRGWIRGLFHHSSESSEYESPYVDHSSTMTASITEVTDDPAMDITPEPIGYPKDGAAIKQMPVGGPKK